MPDSVRYRFVQRSGPDHPLRDTWEEAAADAVAADAAYWENEHVLVLREAGEAYITAVRGPTELERMSLSVD